MKKTLLIISALFLLCPVASFAQKDDREPGLYAICGEESVPLVFQNGTATDPGINILGVVSLSEKKYSFKGKSSNVNADSTFVMVCDMDKKNPQRTLKKYDIFVSSITPDNMLLIPLDVQNNKRIYSEGTAINGFNTGSRNTQGFEWERISDNSYLITVHRLLPGEYGFVFRAAALDKYDFTSLFGFTIPR